MLKRLLAFLLAVALCAVLVSCGEKVKEPPKDNTPAVTDPDENVPTDEDIKVTLSDEELEIPEDADYTGYTFTVFAPYPMGIPLFVSEGLNDTPVNDALYNRNLKLLDTLGVTVNAIDMEYYTHNQAEGIIDDVLAGSHSFDCAAIHHTSACAALIIADAVLSFENLEYCDLSKPWWVQGFSEQCSMMGENYFGISSACYGFYSGASCILFNKTLASEINLPDLYELVRKGEWTVDKMIEFTKNFSQDLNNDGSFDSDDRIAVTTNDHSLLNYWYGAFRQSTVTKGANDQPEYQVSTARMATIVEKLNTLFNTGRRGAIFNMYDNDAITDYSNAFAEGRVLFRISAASGATSLRDYDIDFGIIPLPKLNSDQEEYGSWVDPWCLTLCVPIDCPNPERTSVIIEAMSYYSYQLLYPAVVEQSLFGSGTRDVESLEMLEDYILPNIYFDFGYIYDGWGQGYSSLIRTLIPEDSTDIASYVASNKNVVEAHFNDLYEAMLDKVN